MSAVRCLYVDYNGTTPLRPEVRDVIRESLEDDWANPSSSTPQGIQAKEAIQHARANVAALVNASPHEIIFTSGGTESNNMLLYSIAELYDKPHVVMTTVEHDSVALCARHLFKKGKISLTEVELEDSGCLSAGKVIAACHNNTRLVTVMLANNETGVIFPVADIARKVKTKFPSTLVHTDAAQAIGKIKVDVSELGVDYLTIVGHKFYGPRIGALYRRNEAPLQPLLYGGGQENSSRPGTENTAMIAGLGKAAEIALKNLDKEQRNLLMLRHYLEKKLIEAFKDEIIINCYSSPRLPNTANIAIMKPEFSQGEVLSNVGFVASKGAACHSHLNAVPSQVLLKSGVPHKVALNSIRLSLGISTSLSDIDFIVSELTRVTQTAFSNGHY